MADNTTELTELNAAFATAEFSADAEFFSRHLAEGLRFRRASGKVVDKVTFLKELVAPENVNLRLAVTKIEVLPYGQDLSVCSMVVDFKGIRGGTPAEGLYRNTRVFMRSEGAWKCALWFNSAEPPVATSSLDLTARIAGVHKEILARIEKPEPLAQDVQELLGELSRTLPYLPRLKNAEINVDQAELAIRALLSVEPEVTLARAIREDLARRVDIYKSPVRSVINGRTPATFLLLGVLVHSAVLGLAVFLLSKVIPCQEGVASPCWITMTFAGAVGGATSLFTRLNEIAALSRWGAEGDPLQLFYTGLLKPFVGIVTGLFAYAAISAGIVTIQAPGTGSPATLYLAIAFLAGFSERFAQDLTNATPLGSDKTEHT